MVDAGRALCTARVRATAGDRHGQPRVATERDPRARPIDVCGTTRGTASGRCPPPPAIEEIRSPQKARHATGGSPTARQPACRWDACQVAEQPIDLETAAGRFGCPVLDDIDVAEHDIDPHTTMPQPRTTIHDPTPRRPAGAPRRTPSAARGRDRRGSRRLRPSRCGCPRSPLRVTHRARHRPRPPRRPRQRRPPRPRDPAPSHTRLYGRGGRGEHLHAHRSAGGKGAEQLGLGTGLSPTVYRGSMSAIQQFVSAVADTRVVRRR